MKDEAKEFLILKIMAKAYEISTKTQCDVFVRFAGHVNALDIEIFEDGWSEQNDGENKSIWLYGNTALNELKEIFEKLKKY